MSPLAPPGPAVAPAPLRVLQVIAPGAHGGAETVVSGLSTGLARRDVGVRLAVTLEPEQALPAPFAGVTEAGVELAAVRVRRRAYLGEGRALSEIIRSFAPDVVHTHGYRSDLVAGAAARRARVPAVATVHGFTGGGLKNRLYQSLQRRAWRRFDAVIAVSDALARELDAALGGVTAVHTVPNAWSAPGEPLPRGEARAALGLPAAGRVIGWVGRLSGEKGADLLLEALPLVRGRDVAASFVGEGPEAGALRERARALGLEARVRWHGAVPDAWRYMKAFDVFALSSRTEGTPMVLFEAGHARVPVVAAAVGGVPDLLGTEGGWLVEPEEPRQLARALGEVLETDERGAGAARRLAERLSRRFAPDRWLAAHEAIYLGLARGEPAPAATVE